MCLPRVDVEARIRREVEVRRALNVRHGRVAALRVVDVRGEVTVAAGSARDGLCCRRDLVVVVSHL